MALSIKSKEADRLARELASATGESLTEAVVTALRERLVRQRAGGVAGMTARLRRIRSEVATLPIVDGRSADQIVGYGEHGLPE